MNEFVPLDLDNKNQSCETLNKGSTNAAQTGDPMEVLKNLSFFKNINRLTCAQLNFDPMRNKVDWLVDIVNNNIYILMISETKLD